MADTCGAKKRSDGGHCGRPAGWGTDHPGVGRCKFHGGSTPNHQRAAAGQIAVQLGAPIDIEPHDALLWCVRIAAGEVAFFSAMVGELADDEVVARPVSTLERPLKEEKGAENLSERVTEIRAANPDLHLWIRARQDATERLARYSKMALDAGVAERQVRVAERYGEQIAAMLSGVLGELELTAAQQRRAPGVVRRHLVALEGGQARAA